MHNCCIIIYTRSWRTERKVVSKLARLSSWKRHVAFQRGVTAFVRDVAPGDVTISQTLAAAKQMKGHYALIAKLTVATVTVVTVLQSLALVPTSAARKLIKNAMTLRIVAMYVSAARAKQYFVLWHMTAQNIATTTWHTDS